MDGYRILTNGLLIQTMQQAFSAREYYSFPLAFSKSVFLTGTAQQDSSHSVVFKYTDLSLSQFKFCGAWSNEIQSSWWSGICSVVAIGF